MTIRTKKIATGKYRVYLGADAVPGMILGGRGKWLAERGGNLTTLCGQRLPHGAMCDDGGDCLDDCRRCLEIRRK